QGLDQSGGDRIAPDGEYNLRLRSRTFHRNRDRCRYRVNEVDFLPLQALCGRPGGGPVTLEIARYQYIVRTLDKAQLFKPFFEPFDRGNVRASFMNDPDAVGLALCLGRINGDQGQRRQQQANDLRTQEFFSPDLRIFSLARVNW